MGQKLPAADSTLPKPRQFAGFAEAPQVNPFHLEQAITSGLPRETLRDVARSIWPDTADANRLIHAIVPKSSLGRRDTLSPAQGEQTERLARLFGYATNLFGDIEDARAFMQRPHPELDGRRPVDACLTELGGRAVERVLDSLAFGLPV